MRPTRRPVRSVLGVLLMLVAVNALAGGVYGLSGADAVPTEWLQGTPFETYRFPSLVLLVAVGGSALVAAASVLAKRPWARLSALGSGLVLATWMTVQLSMIGYVSWMQPAFVMIAVLILLLAWLLPGARERPARVTSDRATSDNA